MRREDIKNELASRGFCFLEASQQNVSGHGALAYLGKVVQLENIELIQSLIPKKNAGHNTYSGNFGLGAFPLHTDFAHWAVPPRYMALICVVGSTEVTTTLYDSRQLAESLDENELHRVLVRPRRLTRGGGKSTLSLLQIREEGLLFRWDSLFLVPASPRSKELHDSAATLIGTASVQSIILEKPGDMLLVDNWRMLHGRSMVPLSASARIIERTYLEID